MKHNLEIVVFRFWFFFRCGAPYLFFFSSLWLSLTATSTVEKRKDWLLNSLTNYPLIILHRFILSLLSPPFYPPPTPHFSTISNSPHHLQFPPPSFLPICFSFLCSSPPHTHTPTSDFIPHHYIRSSRCSHETADRGKSEGRWTPIRWHFSFLISMRFHGW